VLPAAITDVLSARIARLGEARPVLLSAAALGLTFDPALLAEAIDADLADVRGALEAGQRAGLLRESDPPASYAFAHELVHDAAYAMLLSSTRRRVHRRAAAILERRMNASGRREPALLADHLERGGEHALAVERWQEAAMAAQATGGHAEAIHHLRHALGLAGNLPADARGPAILRSNALLGASLSATVGYNAPETRAAHEQALSICEELGMHADLLGILGGLTAGHLTSGQIAEAAALAERMVAIARETSDPFRVEAISCLAYAKFFRGELPAALAGLEEAHRAFLARPGGLASSDPRWRLPNTAPVGAISLLGPARWMAGDEAGGLEAMRLACESGPAEFPAGPSSRVFALSYAAWLHIVRGAPQEAAEAALAAVALANRHGFREFEVAALLLLWVAQGMLGDAAAIANLGPVLGAVAAAGGFVFLPLDYAGWGEALLANGRPKEALDALGEAMAVAAASGVHFHDAEIARLRGEALLQLGDTARTEEGLAELQRAAVIAREQGAIAFELRALTACASWDAALGRPATSAPELRALIDRFPGGGAWPELGAARAALDRLAAGGSAR
jgi:tetratricopeptide (TPR) repeat protein